MATMNRRSFFATLAGAPVGVATIASASTAETITMASGGPLPYGYVFTSRCPDPVTLNIYTKGANPSEVMRRIAEFQKNNSSYRRAL